MVFNLIIILNINFLHILQTRREAMIPYFDRLVGQYAALLDARRPWQDRRWAICIFDDLLEYGGAVSGKI